jgi:hypothetical protein
MSDPDVVDGLAGIAPRCLNSSRGSNMVRLHDQSWDLTNA